MSTEPTSPLFRPDAVKAQRTQTTGDVVLVRPISYRLMTGAAFAVACVILSFLIWGSYTEHATLTGQLVPNLGIITVRSPQYGTIIEKHAQEGDLVQQGDVLYTISSDRRSTSLGATQEFVARTLEKQNLSLQAQIEKLRILETTDHESLNRKISALKSATSQLKTMIETQQQRVTLAKSELQRYSKIQADGFISKEKLLAYKDTMLDQQSRLQSLKREKSLAAQQLADLAGQLKGLPAKYENQIAELQRAISGTRQKLGENEAQRRVDVIAPESGVATAVVGEVGQTVDSSSPLLSIIPKGSYLQAQLYAPSSAVGFIEVGDTVLLRYQAYPYQKFGHQDGTVETISRTALAETTRAGADQNGAGRTNEALYLVTVDLSSQTITAYGKQHRLKASMALQADVLQDTRRLYEWILDPLYTLTGKIH